MDKILILTDSTANPRSFPEFEKVNLEETYPYLIRNEYKDSIFYQLTYGNIETEKLLGQAIGYLTHWKPDYIIIQSGLNDCRPEAFTEFQKIMILKFFKFFSLLRKNINNTKIIKKRQIYRVPKKRFKKTVKWFSNVFCDSKIIWLEIAIHEDYEKIRPGVLKRIAEYNQIIEEEFKDNFLQIKNALNEVNGFNSDNIHFNKFGHKIVSELLLKKLATDKNS